nr:MAG TPA: hypothetical protein [Caudoviricetes sp.]
MNFSTTYIPSGCYAETDGATVVYNIAPLV